MRRDVEFTGKRGAKDSNVPIDIASPVLLSSAVPKAIRSSSSMLETDDNWDTKKICRGITRRAVMERFFFDLSCQWKCLDATGCVGAWSFDALAWLGRVSLVRAVFR